MSSASFKPEVWSAETLMAVERALVFGQVVNRDYEGDIAQAGDTVHINAVSDPTISSYSSGGTLTYEDLNTADQVLVIDQSKSFSFKVDDIDKAQNQGDLLPKATSRAGYKLAYVVDQYIEALFSGVPTANDVGTVSVTTGSPTAAYDSVLVPLSVKLDEADVTSEGRFCIVPPWFHGRLLRDDRFVRADASGNTPGGNGVGGNGFIGEAAGFKLYKSNNCSLVTGDDYRVSAGVTDAITLAQQVNEVEALRLQTTFADAVRGLLLYGSKLVRPEMIATATASQT